MTETEILERHAKREFADFMLGLMLAIDQTNWLLTRIMGRV